MIKTIADRRGLIGFFFAVALVVLAACGSSPATGDQTEHASQQGITAQFEKNQPIPAPLRSQMRQNLIEIEQAQADGVQTTSFFFNPNVQDPFLVCPSVGTPISASASLTNPEQLVHDSTYSTYGWGTIGQMDPNGVYTPADTLGTYVVCIGAGGKAIPTYAEGYVHVEYAPATWDYTQHRIVVTGAPTAKFTTGK